MTRSASPAAASGLPEDAVGSVVIEPVAFVRSPYPTKFGVPRQPGLVDALEGRVEFAPAYRNADAVRGLAGFGYVWLLWQFSHNVREGGAWSPTVRPPLLGGSERVGVFATRSSFRPNNLGLSSVRLLGVDEDATCADGGRGPVLRVAGLDMADGTPVFDVKPYLPDSDAHPDAAVGWRATRAWPELDVDIPPEELARVPERLRAGLVQVLRQDPRPAYARTGQEGRVFWTPLADLAVRFTVSGSRLTVVGVERLGKAELDHLRATGNLG